MSLRIVLPTAGVVRVEAEEVPRPQSGELLCVARQSLLSTGTESFCLAGEFDDGTFWNEWVRYPFSPGYSMTSTVTAVGKGVSEFVVGDRVATTTPHAQHFVVATTDAIAIPAEITDEQASWMSLACTTQLGVRRATIELGETVGVIGLGLLGQLVVQYLRIAGAGRIIAIDSSVERLEIARQHGATDLIQSAAGAAQPAVVELTAGGMLDVVFDVTGHFAVLAQASALLRPMGRLILLGDSPSPSKQNLGPRIVGDSISIIGVHSSSAPAASTYRDRWTERAMAHLFFDFLRAGRMNVDDLVTHRYSPLGAAAVYEELRVDRSSHLGVIFDWSGLTS
jgi:threonine dehydrogenase-like Zn-dependent dehydrogenase